MELLELDFADTAAAAAADDDDSDDGDTLLDLVLLELGEVDLLELYLPAERDAELLLPVPVCLVIGWLPLLTLLAVLFSFFEPEEDEDDEIMAATAGAGIDPLLLPPILLSFPLSLILSLLDEVVEPLTRGLDGALKEVAEEREFLSKVCVCV